MDPNKIQNKINRMANNRKSNDFANSLIWADGMLKDKIIDIKIIWLIRWLWAGNATKLILKWCKIKGDSTQARMLTEKNRI